MAVGVPDFPDAVPTNVQNALGKILTDVYSEDVRQDIVDALTWGIGNTSPVAEFINELGLTVSNHMLCYTDSDVLPVYDTIPADISGILQRILSDVYGPDLREAIVTALRWANDYISRTAGFIEDLGLTVVDGKLCAVFYPEQA